MTPPGDGASRPCQFVIHLSPIIAHQAFYCVDESTTLGYLLVLFPASNNVFTSGGRYQISSDFSVDVLNQYMIGVCVFAFYVVCRGINAHVGLATRLMC